MVALKSFPNSSSPRQRTSQPNQPNQPNQNRRLRLVPSRSASFTTARPNRTSPTVQSPVLPPRERRRHPSSQPVAVSPKPKSPHISSPQASANIKRLPSRSLPQRWRTLQILERGISLLTLSLGATTIGIYSLTVQMQQQWIQDYNQLQDLERYERQLVTASEILKNGMAKQAETSVTGLIPQNPNTTIFLDPIEQRSLRENQNTLHIREDESSSKTPLGY